MCVHVGVCRILRAANQESFSSETPQGSGCPPGQPGCGRANLVHVSLLAAQLLPGAARYLFTRMQTYGTHPVLLLVLSQASGFITQL